MRFGFSLTISAIASSSASVNTYDDEIKVTTYEFNDNESTLTFPLGLCGEFKSKILDLGVTALMMSSKKQTRTSNKSIENRKDHIHRFRASTSSAHGSASVAAFPPNVTNFGVPPVSLTCFKYKSKNGSNIMISSVGRRNVVNATYSDCDAPTVTAISLNGSIFRFK